MNSLFVVVCLSYVSVFSGCSAKYDVDYSSIDQKLLTLQITKCLQLSAVNAFTYYTLHSYETTAVENTCLKFNLGLQRCMTVYGVDNCESGLGSSCSGEKIAIAHMVYGFQDAVNYLCSDENIRTIFLKHFDDCFFTASIGYTYLKCTASFIGRLFFQKIESDTMCQSFEDLKSCVANKVPDTCKNANAAKILKELQEKVFSRFVDIICDLDSTNEGESSSVKKSIFDMLMDI
jgi:hypothetical protein